ncbi:probable C-mannosyltransferase DPY19L1 [Actinia tenebrosa]|uniref:Probable C-mannosyltransferase DPY19L1 n=1 Tax=Actinia tenebrosa TaxID=6105 RepID=A0A6P8HJP4_ACTTE|nr:probable C-mannosyltransferase DPY19L1 [Actinia tenebrosa]
MTLKKKRGPNTPHAKSSNPGNSKKSSAKAGTKSRGGEMLGSFNGVGYFMLVIFLAFCAGVLHSKHVSHMFENERFFSHLSALERELSFRTEMGLYYSYYKTIVEAPNFFDGVYDIMHCNVTEFPDTVNTLKRFNLYPEVVLGFMFRCYEQLASYFNYQTKVCYTVNRGQGLPPVQSCEGLGELSFFYVFFIFSLSGLMMACFFILCYYLSGSILGGILGTLCYFYNHGEATRVMWTPPLRESFSYPFLVAQLLVVTYTIKSVTVNWWNILLVAVTTITFMIPWQFAQFVLLTQTCALFGLYALRFLTSHKLCIILYGLAIAHAVNFVFQFGNSMLLSSFFLSALISTLVIAKLETPISKLPNQICIWLVQAVIFVVGTFSIKISIAKSLGIEDDAHIVSILKSKFSNYQDFHTSLYTCAPEFDFIERETFTKLSKTLLLPAAILSLAVVLSKIAIDEWKFWFGTGTKSETKEEKEEESPNDVQPNPKPNAEYFYHVLQAIAFIMMAVIIMRLKLFGTPALCVLASLLASRKFFGFIGDKRRHQAIVICLIAMMTVQGYQNLRVQFNTSGEYNNPDLEDLVEFITTRTSRDSVFAGAMPTMATVKLCTKRAIVNHPHYEDVGIRERTHKVYQIFSRKPPKVVWNTLNSMGVTHVIVDSQWCLGRPKPGCGMVDMWDREDQKNRNRPACCMLIEENPAPFKKVFKNKKYSIFQLHSK